MLAVVLEDISLNNQHCSKACIPLIPIRLRKNFGETYKHMIKILFALFHVKQNAGAV